MKAATSTDPFFSAGLKPFLAESSSKKMRWQKNQALNLGKKGKRMRVTKLTTHLFLLAMLCFALSVTDASAQFNRDEDSGFRIPLPMGVFTGEDSKKTVSLQLETVLEENFIGDQLAVDSNIFYWINRGGSTTLRYGKLRTGQLDVGGYLDKNLVGHLIVADQGKLYWVNSAGELYQGDAEDGSLRNEKLLAEKFNVKLFAVDNGTLYWQEEGSNALHTGKVVDGKLQDDGIVDKNFRAKLLTADKGVIYWVDRNTRALRHGQVKEGKLKDLGVLSGNFTGKLLAVENANFFWLDQKEEELCYGRVR